MYLNITPKKDECLRRLWWPHSGHEEDVVRSTLVAAHTSQTERQHCRAHARHIPSKLHAFKTRYPQK